MICDVLNVFEVDPVLALTVLSEKDSLEQLLGIVSGLTVTPSPISVRHKASMVIAVIYHHLAEAKGSYAEMISVSLSAVPAVYAQRKDGAE